MTPSPAILAILMLAQLPPSLADPQPVPIGGTVVDASGHPAAGAVVWLSDAATTEEIERSGWSLLRRGLLDPGLPLQPVIGRAETDARGRFALELPATAAARQKPVPLAVWAIAPAPVVGSAPMLAMQRLPATPTGDDCVVAMTLEAKPPAELIVLAPDGRPVAGARIIPSRFRDVSVPDSVGEPLAATTGRDGRAILAGVAADRLDAVRVEAAGLGTQEVGWLRSRGPKPAVTLAPVGRIAGRLVPFDGSRPPIEGVAIRVTTWAGGYAGSGIVGTARARCDREGRFEVPAIAAGSQTLTMYFDPAADITVRGAPSIGQLLAAGKTTEIAIPLQKSLRVRGLYRERVTGAPIAGVLVELNGLGGGDRLAITGASGEFAGYILPNVNQPFGWPLVVPRPFYRSADLPEVQQSMPRRDVAELVLPAVELPRGVDVSGTVVGDGGQPVAGAEVRANGVTVRSDARGRFVLAGSNPLADLKIAAWIDDAATAAPVVTRAEAARNQPVTVSISMKNTTGLAGRVIDPSGRPVAAAEVAIWRLIRMRRGGRIAAGQVIARERVASASGTMVVRTGADGRFRAPRRVALGEEYVAEATAFERLAGNSRPIVLRAGAETPEWPPIVLPRVRSVTGTVVDRRGNPLAGAVVFQSGDGPMRTETASDERGQFTLPGFVEGPAFVFVRKPGYPMALQPVTGDPAPVRLVLAKESDGPAIAYKTLPSVLPAEEETALARRLVGPCVERVLAGKNEVEAFRLLMRWAEIDPAAARERFETLKFNDPDLRGSAAVQVAEGIARWGDGPDEAAAFVEALADTRIRAAAYLLIAKSEPPTKSRERLEQAILNIKAVPSPVDQVRLLGETADTLIDLGEAARARGLLAQAQELDKGTIKGIRGGGFNSVAIAVGLARLDLPAALAILDALDRDVRKVRSSDPSRILNRFYGGIALRLADRSPADAERVLEHLVDHPGNGRFILQTCVTMAAKDLPRARRLVEHIPAIEATLIPYALGLMAQATAQADRPAAAALLDEAFARLDAISAAWAGGHPDVTAVAAGLLPAVEQVAPERLPEFLARALAVRPTIASEDAEADASRSAGRTAQLAIVVARYDRDLAARLVAPALDQLDRIGQTYLSAQSRTSVLAALALIDPRRAVAMVEAIPEQPGGGTTTLDPKNNARLAIATLLAHHGADRWRSVYVDLLRLWTPDQRSL